MRRETSEWSVRMLADLKGRINVDAPYQRGVIWSDAQQMLLIDSILRRFDIPKIFLQKLPDGSQELYQVIDGVQRLTSIWRFLSDQLRLPAHYEYPRIGPVGGKTWSELPQSAKDRLQFAKLTVTELETKNDDDVRELFQRLQEGEPLNAAERRNAMDVPIRHFVADVLVTHRLWAATGIKNRRSSWAEMSAIVLALVNARGPTGLKGADLWNLYEDTSFNSTGSIANETIKSLDRLYEVAQSSRGTIRTRWGIVDLHLTLQQLICKEIQPIPDTVMQFFMAFETERRAATTALSDLRSTVVGFTSLQPDSLLEIELPDIEPGMLSYVNAFTREGATKHNVAVRSHVMTKRLLEYLQ